MGKRKAAPAADGDAREGDEETATSPIRERSRRATQPPQRFREAGEADAAFQQSRMISAQAGELAEVGGRGGVGPAPRQQNGGGGIGGRSPTIAHDLGHSRHRCCPRTKTMTRSGTGLRRRSLLLRRRRSRRMKTKAGSKGRVRQREAEARLARALLRPTCSGRAWGRLGEAGPAVPLPQHQAVHNVPVAGAYRPPQPVPQGESVADHCSVVGHSGKLAKASVIQKHKNTKTQKHKRHFSKCGALLSEGRNNGCPTE